MKKSTLIAVIVIILVIVGIIWLNKEPSKEAVLTPSDAAASTSPVPVTETTKVSLKTSKYENAELGFSVNYPTAWDAESTNTGVTFLIPVDKTQVSTVAELQGVINAYASKCSFPPVTTIKDRGTITVGKSTLNTISMSNTVQGRQYFNRMYSLQSGPICYMFQFSAITLAPESKKLTGSNLTQAQNNNKAIVNTADSEFISMVKSFAFVQGPAAQDETKVAPPVTR